MKKIFLISLVQLISAASISQIKQADRSLLHPEFMPKSQNTTKSNEFYYYYDYDQYYEDYGSDKMTDYYPQDYEYSEEDQDLLEIKPKSDTKISTTTIQAQTSNQSSNSLDYEYYDDNGEEDYYELSNSRGSFTTTQSTTTKDSTKSSISILSFLFINSTSKPVEIIQPLSEINKIPDLIEIKNISDNLIHKALFTDNYDLYQNRDEDEFKTEENAVKNRPSSTVPSNLNFVQTSSLLPIEEYGNYTDMYYYDDFYDFDEYYDDLFSYNDEKKGDSNLTDVAPIPAYTEPLPNLNINLIATVSYNTTNFAPTTTHIPSTTPQPSTTVQPTSERPSTLSIPSLYDNFVVNEGDFIYKPDDDYFDNYFEDSDEYMEEKEDLVVVEPEIKTRLNTTLLSLTIKELLKSPALIAGICGGLLVGIITALVLLFFIIYRMKRNKLDDSTYVVNSKNSPIYGNFKTKGQNITLMSSSSVSPNTNLSTGSTSSATTGLLNGHAMTSSRLLKYANHSTSLKKSCSIMSSDSSSSSPNHDGSFNYAYIKAPTKEFYA